MTTNLIHNYIASGTSSKPTSGNRKAQDPNKKPKPHFDIEHELNNRTFIKPLEGKGHLINGNIFNMPALMVKDTIYDAKAFKHAVNGKANDHELGKLNDVGLKIGGLAIAGYLFTRKQTPMTKGMELIGLGSFLASMAIWPKLAIQLPAYLIHGINVQKQYEDSFGRKKPFYQDPQFIPWDLYSDKEIQKIGNRLGVPKNIPNRREAIQEKMKKIAIQNNTLWMLTAGFATPVMSALICNRTEPYLAKWLNDRKNKKADKILNNLDKYSEKYKTHTISNKLEEIISLYGNKPVDNNLIEKITDAFSLRLDPVTSESLKEDLKNLMTSDKVYTIDDNTAKDISKNLKKLFKNQKIDDALINAVVPNEDAMIKLFKDNNFFNTAKETKEFQAIKNKITKTIQARLKKYNKSVPEESQYDWRFIQQMISNTKSADHPVDKALYKVPGVKFDTTIQAKLRHVAQITDDFSAKTSALDEYAAIKVGSAPETVIANYWNDISKDILKIFGINYKEIKQVRADRNLVGGLVRNKIEQIVSDDELYKKVMKSLVAKIAQINNQIKPSDISASILKKEENLNDKQKVAARSAYDTIVDKEFNAYANALAEVGEKDFENLSRAIAGFNPDDTVGTAKNIQKVFVSDRLLGVKSSFYRLINTMDFYRRIAKQANNMNSINMYPREIKEEIIELCKIITLEGHSSDNATKFYMQRNPHPSTDTSPLVVENGKVINNYYGRAAGTADIPGDKYFYQRAMQLMFEEKLNPETADILKGSLIEDEVMNYRELVLDKIGGENYMLKPRHRIRPESDAGSDLKFLLTGIAPDEFFFKSGKQFYNSNKWFKIFGTFGAALLGVTVLAQFFFGKTKNSKQGSAK